jgi:hypothetical protein
MSLVGLARELGKQDKEKALKVLREAAAAAKRMTLPGNQPMAGMLAAMGDFAGSLRVLELINVAGEAQALGARPEAEQWLTEAETMAQKLPELQRHQPLSMLASAWVRLDPKRTEKLLAALGPDSSHWDLAVSGIVARLLPDDPEAALAWLDRFKNQTFPSAQEYRCQIVIRLVDKDLPRAQRLAEVIRDPVYRGLTRARLATSVGLADRKKAHELIDLAANDLAAEPTSTRHEGELAIGACVYLLWQAKAVDYPDLASLVAVALTSRPPVRQEHAAENRRYAMLHLAAGVGSLDPSLGRSLLGLNSAESDSAEEEDNFFQLFWVQALTDPKAALALLDADAPKRRRDLDWYTATEALAILKQRSDVVVRMRLLERMEWVLGQGAPEDD